MTPKEADHREIIGPEGKGLWDEPTSGVGISPALACLPATEALVDPVKPNAEVG